MRFDRIEYEYKQIIRKIYGDAEKGKLSTQFDKNEISEPNKEKLILEGFNVVVDGSSYLVQWGHVEYPKLTNNECPCQIHE